jgi:hypothetical protein
MRWRSLERRDSRGEGFELCAGNLVRIVGMGAKVGHGKGKWSRSVGRLGGRLICVLGPLSHARVL